MSLTLTRYQVLALVLIALFTVIVTTFVVLNATAQINVWEIITYKYPY